MKPVQLVILAAIVVVAGVRITLRRRRGQGLRPWWARRRGGAVGGGTDPGTAAAGDPAVAAAGGDPGVAAAGGDPAVAAAGGDPAVAGSGAGRAEHHGGRSGWLAALVGASPTALVAEREMRQRAKSRVFRIGSLILVVAVAAGVVLPEELHHSAPSPVVAVVGPVSAATGAEGRAVAVLAARAGTRVRVTAEASRAAAERALRSGTVALVLDGDQLLIDKALVDAGTTTADLARTMAVGFGLLHQLQAAGLPPADVARLADPAPLTVHSLQPPTHKAANVGTTVIVLILMYVLLTQYGTWILTGVVQEKSSRVVEVLLATIRPAQLLAGKVLGIGTMAMAQGMTVVAVALVAAEAVGSSVVKGTSLPTVAVGLLWLVLGYAFYCWIYAAAGSLVERQEDVQTIAFPLQVPMLIGYLITIIGVSSPTPSVLVRVLAFVPPTAPFAMPLCTATGVATWWQVLVSVVLMLAATAAVARVAGVVYQRAVLRTGSRVRLKEVLSA